MGKRPLAVCCLKIWPSLTSVSYNILCQSCETIHFVTCIFLRDFGTAAELNMCECAGMSPAVRCSSFNLGPLFCMRCLQSWLKWQHDSGHRWWQPIGFGDCLKNKSGDYRNHFILQLCTVISTFIWTVRTSDLGPVGLVFFCVYIYIFLN